MKIKSDAGIKQLLIKKKENARTVPRLLLYTGWASDRLTGCVG